MVSLLIFVTVDCSLYSSPLSSFSFVNALSPASSWSWLPLIVHRIVSFCICITVGRSSLSDCVLPIIFIVTLLIFVIVVCSSSSYFVIAVIDFSYFCIIVTVDCLSSSFHSSSLFPFIVHSHRLSLLFFVSVVCSSSSYSFAIFLRFRHFSSFVPPLDAHTCWYLARAVS